MTPALTVVVPTYNRPALLPRALRSILIDQTRSDWCRVIVADDGDTDHTDTILRQQFGEALDSGQIRHLKTGAPDAWTNWRAGALAAETAFVAWVQDDDVVSPLYIERIIKCFNDAEKFGVRPSVWMACLDGADCSSRFGLHYVYNGPYVPMHTLHGVCEPIHYRYGIPIAVSSYFTSQSLSPALAYRNGDRFHEVLRRMPPRCDIFIERMIPAEMALDGGFIADPAVIGYWVQHGQLGSQLSHQQWEDQPRQTSLLVPYLDDILDRNPDWEEQFKAWLGVVPPGHVIIWLGQFDTTEREGGKSRHGTAIRKAMYESLSGRIKAIKVPWRIRAADWLKRRMIKAQTRCESRRHRQTGQYAPRETANRA